MKMSVMRKTKRKLRKNKSVASKESSEPDNEAIIELVTPVTECRLRWHFQLLCVRFLST